MLSQWNAEAWRTSHAEFHTWKLTTSQPLKFQKFRLVSNGHFERMILIFFILVFHIPPEDWCLDPPKKTPRLRFGLWFGVSVPTDPHDRYDWGSVNLDVIQSCGRGIDSDRPCDTVIFDEVSPMRWLETSIYRQSPSLASDVFPHDIVVFLHEIWLLLWDSPFVVGIFLQISVGFTLNSSLSLLPFLPKHGLSLPPFPSF